MAGPIKCENKDTALNDKLINKELGVQNRMALVFESGLEMKTVIEDISNKKACLDFLMIKTRFF